jgi:hypothetical protein
MRHVLFWNHVRMSKMKKRIEKKGGLEIAKGGTSKRWEKQPHPKRVETAWDRKFLECVISKLIKDYAGTKNFANLTKLRAVLGGRQFLPSFILIPRILTNSDSKQREKQSKWTRPMLWERSDRWKDAQSSQHRWATIEDTFSLKNPASTSAQPKNMLRMDQLFPLFSPLAVFCCVLGCFKKK